MILFWLVLSTAFANESLLDRVSRLTAVRPVPSRTQCLQLLEQIEARFETDAMDRATCIAVADRLAQNVEAFDLLKSACQLGMNRPELKAYINLFVRKAKAEALTDAQRRNEAFRPKIPPVEIPSVPPPRRETSAITKKPGLFGRARNFLSTFGLPN